MKKAFAAIIVAMLASIAAQIKTNKLLRIIPCSL